MDSNSLVNRQTIYSLSASIGEAHFALQIACMQFYAQVTFEDQASDESVTAVGQALAQLRASCTKLETFLFTLDRKS